MRKRQGIRGHSDDRELISCLLTLKLSLQVTNIRLGAAALITPLTGVESTACHPSLPSSGDSRDPRRSAHTMDMKMENLRRSGTQTASLVLST